MSTMTEIRNMALERIQGNPMAKKYIREAAGSAEMNEGVKAMLKRVDDFPDPLIALLSGIGVHAASRQHLDRATKKIWNEPWRTPLGQVPEVVIGSGPHALIYAAIRASKGVKVVVLEQSTRAGGSFACTEGPSFWLNSRNRPGSLGLPGEGKGLNCLPGAMLQPSMIGGGEYQTNAELAWVIRLNLMMSPNIEVHTGVEVVAINRSFRQGELAGFNLSLGGASLKDGRANLYAARVIVATGAGKHKSFNVSGAPVPPRLLNFPEFMAKMDAPFPLRGMKRVAVIGAGDSGKTAIETFLGQGPSMGMSVSGLDFPEQIDWYGCQWSNQASFCAENRGRYNRIGKALGNRVTVKPRAGYYPTTGYDSVQIGPKIYDWVINCTGYTREGDVGSTLADEDYLYQARVLARRLKIVGAKDEIYRIGPAAAIEYSASDQAIAPQLAAIPQNAISLFRYASLTSTLAATLPAV